MSTARDIAEAEGRNQNKTTGALFCSAESPFLVVLSTIWHCTRPRKRARRRRTGGVRSPNHKPTETRRDAGVICADAVVDDGGAVCADEPAEVPEAAPASDEEPAEEPAAEEPAARAFRSSSALLLRSRSEVGDGENRASARVGTRLPVRAAIRLSCTVVTAGKSASPAASACAPDDDPPELPASPLVAVALVSVHEPCSSHTADQRAASAAAFVWFMPFAVTRFVTLIGFLHLAHLRTSTVNSSPFQRGSEPAANSAHNASRWSSSAIFTDAVVAHAGTAGNNQCVG